MKPSIRCLFVTLPFDAFTQQPMIITLDNINVVPHEKNGVLSTLGTMKKDIVGK